MSCAINGADRESTAIQDNLAAAQVAPARHPVGINIPSRIAHVAAQLEAILSRHALSALAGRNRFLLIGGTAGTRVRARIAFLYPFLCCALYGKPFCRRPMMLIVQGLLRSRRQCRKA